jgi:hypothetical protein
MKYIIKTTDKQTLNYSTTVPYIEAVLHFLDLKHLVPLSIHLDGKEIDLQTTYNLNQYKKNYLNIMQNPTLRRSTLTHINTLENN